MPRVTAINDSPEFLALMREVLTPEYQVTTLRAETVSAEELVASRPDLLLVDFPRGEEEERDGWRVLFEARERPELRDVPLVVTTADLAIIAELDEEIRAARGVVLAKPFSLAQLESVVARQLGGAAAPGEDR